jgi:hypothetical protein
MRIALVFATLILGFSIGSQAFATVNPLQEQKADQLCNEHPNQCGQG